MASQLDDAVGESVSIGGQPTVFDEIANSKSALAIWHRDLAEPLTLAADHIKMQDLDINIKLNPFCDIGALQLAERFADLSSDQSKLFVEDILELARRFADIYGGEHVQIRLETVDDDGCRFFHTDNVVMRLVVTYAGAGTQWISPEFSSLAHHQQTDYNGPMNHIRTGDVAIFCGKKSSVDGLILHRSPPHSPDRAPRLVVVIDSVDV